ncbi:serine hydrolase-like protein 2 isoform X2 [Belonocnema kinseyi]|uniref:serine hydrolase-like protein 2 isoform X2 n=1 Tax=Belonocnema kinseyi TaxID=2817044 RepID=UPI00143CC500|nr:serine hydrolase-like protein 2 isoform X2 [Belonocnema kinseyi]
MDLKITIIQRGSILMMRKNVKEASNGSCALTEQAGSSESKKDINTMESEMKTEEIRFKVPWGHVAAKAWGSPKNSPVLVVHGLMDNAGSFSRLISLLPKQFYYVCIDLPGHGYSSHFPSGVPLNFFDYVLCIRFVLQELNWKSCVCIAHSIGAMIIYFYTYIYPGIIKKLVSIDTAVPRPYDGDLLKSRVIEEHNSALDHLNNEENKVFSREEIIYVLQAKRKHYMKKEAAEAMFERTVTKVDGGYKYNRDQRLRIIPRPLFNDKQCVEYLKKETVPTLFIVPSTLSQFLSEEGLREKSLEVVKTKKMIEFVVVEGNHDIHTNHPERIAPLIERFFENVTSKL